MNLNGATFTHGVNALVRLAFDIDVAGLATKKLRQVSAHFFFYWSNFWTLTNHGGVKIGNLKFFLAHQHQGGSQEMRAVFAGPLWIGVWEKLPNVRQRKRAKNGVGDGVQKCVTVGVSNWTAIMVNQNSAKNKRLSLTRGREWFKAMQVITVADANHFNCREYRLFLWSPCRLARRRKAVDQPFDRFVSEQWHWAQAK